jgi:hypothetical protein
MFQNVAFVKEEKIISRGELVPAVVMVDGKRTKAVAHSLRVLPGVATDACSHVCNIHKHDQQGKLRLLTGSLLP